MCNSSFCSVLELDFSQQRLRQSNIGNTDAGVSDRNLVTSMKAGENILQIKITLFSTTNTLTTLPAEIQGKSNTATECNRS